MQLEFSMDRIGYLYVATNSNLKFNSTGPSSIADYVAAV